VNLFTASSLLVAPGEYYPGGGVLLDGQVQRVARSPGEVSELATEFGVEVQDLGAGLLAPGLVNAHAHLELTGVDTGPDRSFRGWLAGLMAVRGASTHADRCRAATAGADELLRSGTTAVGDIDSTGAAQEALRGHSLRLRLYREVIDAYAPERTSRALELVRKRLGLRPGMSEGISPHAPYTVSPALFDGLREIAETHALAVTIHWSETPEEVEWTLRGSGPMQGLIPRSPMRSGLDLIEEAGLLTRTTSLVHGNHPAAGEIERIARAGSVCVHCPGSHAFFGRDPFPVFDYMEAGVPIALGTDSAASNDRLDMRREMSLIRAAHPGLRPEDVWSMATVNGARALGMPGDSGTLRPGADADFCLWDVDVSDADTCLEALTSGTPEVVATWIGGRQVSCPQG
jgi:cytosine/adenosine deaminase-related metal-dependent hydrolase